MRARDARGNPIELTVLVASSLRRSAVRAAEWLVKSRVEKVFLNLPTDFEPFVRAYAENSIGPSQLWKGFEYLTGLRGPHLGAIRGWSEPILDALPKARYEVRDLEVACYVDLEFYLRANKLVEELLLLEYRERATGGLRLEEWREIVRRQLECQSHVMSGAVQNVLERLTGDSAMIYGGSVGALRALKEHEGVRARPVYLDEYWKPPFQALCALAVAKGLDNLSDEEVEPFVRDHMRYLDCVLSSEDLDAAHEGWSLKHRPFKLGGAVRGLEGELRPLMESA